MQKTYSLFQAKTKFSELIRLVKNGERVLVTERGKPVAEVVQIAGEEASLEARISNLSQRGHILNTDRDSSDLLNYIPAVSRPGALHRFLEDRD